MQPLKKLREILEVEVAWYTESPGDKEHILALFLSSKTNETVDGRDWVSWAVSYKELSAPLIKSTFEQAFPGKELLIKCGTGLGGLIDYIYITGKSITLTEILAHAKNDSEVFDRNAERFIAIVLEKIRRDVIQGHRIITLEERAQGDFHQDEEIRGMHYITWWMMVADLDKKLIEDKLVMCIHEQFPGEQNFFLETCSDPRTYTIAFFSEEL